MALHVYPMATCADCGGDMVLRNSPKTGGKFLGCSGYPSCRFTVSYDETLADLGRTIRDLRTELQEVYGRVNASGNGKTVAALEKIDGKARDFVARWHPDKHPQPVSATEVCAALNWIRDAIKATR